MTPSSDRQAILPGGAKSSATGMFRNSRCISGCLWRLGASVCRNDELINLTCQTNIHLGTDLESGESWRGAVMVGRSMSVRRFDAPNSRSALLIMETIQSPVQGGI